MRQTGTRPALPARELCPVADWPPLVVRCQTVPTCQSRRRSRRSSSNSRRRRRRIYRRLGSLLRGVTTPPKLLLNTLCTRSLEPGSCCCFTNLRVKKVRDVMDTFPLHRWRKYHYKQRITFSQISLPESDWEADNSKSWSRVDAGLQTPPPPRAAPRLGERLGQSCCSHWKHSIASIE